MYTLSSTPYTLVKLYRQNFENGFMYFGVFGPDPGRDRMSQAGPVYGPLQAHMAHVGPCGPHYTTLC